jgi:branched-chain amino acid transport system ATP-binding protein
MNDAQCLLLDEPMAGVEGQLYSIMQRVVREVAESGVAVGVVEHNVAFIRDLCDEGVFMFSGKILARGNVADLIADTQLTELYFGT